MSNWTPDYSRYEGHTPGPWKVGDLHRNTVIADAKYAEGRMTGHDDVDYYGGVLIGESIMPQNRNVIADAPQLLAYCKRLEARVKELESRQNMVCTHCGYCGSPGNACPKCPYEMVPTGSNEGDSNG